MSANDFLFYVEGLVKKYGSKMVVNDLSFGIRQGEVLGLLGPNGAGKTTAFYMAIGLVHQDKGKIVFKGKDISSYSIYKRAQM